MRPNEGMMRGHRAVRVLKFAAIAVAGVTVFGFVVEYLWNWLAPSVFGGRPIGFWQALGLLILSKILFSGFHRGGRGGGWNRRHMDERWANMSAEERERFRAGMRGRRGGRCGGPTEPAAEQTGG